MNINAVTRVCLVLLAMAAQGASQTEYMMDLTTPEVRQMDDSRTSGCGSRGGKIATSGGSVPDPEVPLALQLESLNRSDFRTGDEVVAVVRLTNTGTKPVMIPWNPDSEAVFGKNCRWPYKSLGSTGLMGSVSLVFMDEAGYTQFLAGHGLYAISRRAETYRTLAPGQSAGIKIWGSVHFYNLIEKRRAKGLEFKLPQEFVVSASLDLDDSALYLPYKTIRSKNFIRLKVAEK